jgi:hypothetical protein
VLAGVESLARALLDLDEPPVPAAGNATVFGRLFHAFGLT